MSTTITFDGSRVKTIYGQQVDPSYTTAIALSFTLAERSSLLSVGVYIAGKTPDWTGYLRIYTDYLGFPGALVAEPVYSIYSLGWNNRPISGTLEAGTYWLVLSSRSSGGSGQVATGYDTDANAGAEYSAAGGWTSRGANASYNSYLEYGGTSPAANPAPTDNAYGVVLNLPYLMWEHPDESVTFDVYFKQASGPEFGFFHKIADHITDRFVDLSQVVDPQLVFPSGGRIPPLDYGGQHGAGEGYYWRVDTRYPDDTVVQGDVWSFSTVALTPPVPDGMSYDMDTGELTGTPTGRNAMVTLRKLVAFARNSVFVEE